MSTVGEYFHTCDAVEGVPVVLTDKLNEFLRYGLFSGAGYAGRAGRIGR